MDSPWHPTFLTHPTPPQTKWRRHHIKHILNYTVYTLMHFKSLWISFTIRQRYFMCIPEMPKYFNIFRMGLILHTDVAYLSSSINFIKCGHSWFHGQCDVQGSSPDASFPACGYLYHIQCSRTELEIASTSTTASPSTFVYNISSLWFSSLLSQIFLPWN